MAARRIMAGTIAVAACATVLFVLPASGATDRGDMRMRRPVSARIVPGAFTPAAADPRLAAVFARGGLDAGNFRFTPAETRHSRPVTVAVRARSNRSDSAARAALAATPTVGIAPIAYNLGVAVGWKRFALSGDVNRVDLAGQPGGREAADLAVSYSTSRFTGQVRAAADRPLATLAPGIERDRSYSLDLGGSYAVTRNLDVTAGLRYRTERDRLARLDDDRRDSQAVYVGTAFRF